MPGVGELAESQEGAEVWLRMVARAALATPQRKTATNNRSNTTLVREAKIRYFMGLRLSPTDWRMLAHML